MTFASNAGRRHSSKPISLYHVVFGTEVDAFVAYTDSSEPVTFNTITYVPLPIDRSRLVVSGGMDKSTMTIQVPKDSKLAELFRIYPPSQVVRMTVRQGHTDDPEFLVIWTGRITQAKRSQSTTELSCEPMTTMMRRVGLRRNYQLSCPHALYGDQCKASQVAATISRNVLTMTGSKVTLADGWNPGPSEKYLGGIVSWDAEYGTEHRTILKVIADNTLSLSGPLSGLSAGQTLRIAKGCNRQMSDCLDVHNNIYNFGGQPFIPTKNPVNKNPFS